MKRSANAAGNISATAEPQFVAQLHLLRARVEAELPKPAVILVTSAARGDGKSMVAHSLADSFMRAGHRAALVHLTRDRAERNDVPEICAADARGVVAGPDRVDALVAKMRSDYDFTVVDAGPFLVGSAAISLARLVDGILLAVRVGRPQTDDDELMMQTIEQSGGRVVGVVAADGQAIADFGEVR